MKKKTGKEFKQLEEELTPYLKMMTKASDVVMDQGVSEFPIFVVHQHTVDIGINIVDRENIKGNWSVNASSLEEFVTKQILSSPSHWKCSR